MIPVLDNTKWAMLAVLAVMLVGTNIVWLLRVRHPERDYTELTQRVRSWWYIAVLFMGALLLGRLASLVLMALISYLALREYLSIVPTRRADRRVLLWAYWAIPVQYLWIGLEWYGMFIIFVPVYMFLFLPMLMVLRGETRGYINAAGSLHWGLMLTVYALSHMAYLLVLPPERNPAGGGAGLVVYLVFLTQFNDVAQYTWGKLVGRHPVSPQVSPKKTVEGLAGGVITTAVLSMPLAAWLTPLNWAEGLGAGLLIGLAGFVGDVTLSALKRDLGIKDSSQLIPGHGGILDRVDSLTFSAPLFFHYLYYLHY